MHLYSQKAELRCIRTLTESRIPENIRSTLLSRLDTTYFHFPPTLAAFNRIAKLAKKRQELIDYEDLQEDPLLEEDFREILRSTDVGPCRNKRLIKRMYQQLEQYRKIRILYKQCRKSLEQLEDDKVDPDRLLDDLANSVAQARKDVQQDQTILNFGHASNSKNVVHNVLYSTEELLYKTGYTEYDERNGGLPKEGVMIIGATTSGGKSVTTMNLLRNLHMENKINVVRASFEMGDTQETRRFLSCISGIPFTKFIKKRLTMKEKQAVEKAVEKFEKFGQKHEIKFSTVSPTRSMSIEEVLRMIKPYGYQVVAIDYITLLAGVDTDNQWQVLSEIARYAKEFSRQTNSLVILLAQIDDATEKLRYSKGIREHADVFWFWNYSKPEQRELKSLPINVGKARDGELFTFNLDEEFEFMRVSNPNGDDDEIVESVSEEDILESTSSAHEADEYAGTGME